MWSDKSERAHCGIENKNKNFQKQFFCKDNLCH